MASLSVRGKRGQMFLPPGADNPSYATASARQCKCGHFSLLYREQERAVRCRPIVRTHPTAGLGSPVLGVWGPVGDRVPPVALHVCVLTRAPGRLRPGRCPPFCVTAHPPATSTNCQRCPTGSGGDSLACRPGGRSAIVLPRSWSPSSPLSRPFCDV